MVQTSNNAELKPQPTTDQPMLPPEPKHWYQSKMIWFNLIVGAAALATSATPALEQHMSPEVYAVLLATVNFINAVLRLVTGQPIKGGGNG